MTAENLGIVIHICCLNGCEGVFFSFGAGGRMVIDCCVRNSDTIGTVALQIAIRSKLAHVEDQQR